MVGQMERPPRRLGILTGGGDVPGLNAAIKSVVYRAEPQGIEVVGLRAGWEGISYLNRNLSVKAQEWHIDDPSTWERCYVRPLSRLSTRGIDRHGGTILQSTRTNPARLRVGDLPPHLAHRGEGHPPDDRIDLTDEVIKNIEFLGLDGLIAIGGDDTLSYAAKLSEMGVPVWAIPKTMDNDVPGTEYAIGFQTAINRAAEFIGRMRSTAGSHRENSCVQDVRARCRLYGSGNGTRYLDRPGAHT